MTTAASTRRDDQVARTGRRFLRDQRVLWRRVTTGVLLLPQSSTGPHTLSGAGSALWDVLEQPHSFGEIVTRLADQFDVAPEAISASVEFVLDDLHRLGAIVVVDT
jgi:hypothetical protein